MHAVPTRRGEEGLLSQWSLQRAASENVDVPAVPTHPCACQQTFAASPGLSGTVTSGHRQAYSLLQIRGRTDLRWGVASMRKAQEEILPLKGLVPFLQDMSLQELWLASAPQACWVGSRGGGSPEHAGPGSVGRGCCGQRKGGHS